MTVRFPNLFDLNGQKVLPTYISHLITSSRFPLTELVITNTGGPGTMVLSVDLPTYGSPATQTLAFAAGETKTVTMSPIINFNLLFQNTTTVPAGITVGVNSGGNQLFGQTFQIQITGRNTVFWSVGNQVAVPLVATMVTPQDRSMAINTVLRGAAARFPGNILPGYQNSAWPAASYTLSPGYHQSESFYVMQGESPSVQVAGVAGGSDNNFAVFIATEAEYQVWASGQSASACASNNMATGSFTLTCSTPTSGWYRVVYNNPSNNFVSRTVTRSRPMTHWEVTFHQSRAIFDELRARGLTYVNLPGTGFFSAAQSVRYPAESITGMGANCVDGALLFASAWEALGMDPLLAVSFSAGHAFAAVRCWSGSPSCIVPIETTLVGSMSSAYDAYVQGSNTWSTWSANGSLIQVDVPAMRAQGVTPAPM